MLIINKSYNPLSEETFKIIKSLNVRGRDNYSAAIITATYTIEEFTSVNYTSFLDFLKDVKSYKALMLHARAIPETETNTYTGSNIYTNNHLYVMHHGIIPNAEKINPIIRIDSEALLDIYKDFDKNNIQNWFIQSLNKYPRATTEIIYNVKERYFAIASNFMPLYKYENDNVIIYTTYKVNDKFCATEPYSIYMHQI